MIHTLVLELTYDRPIDADTVESLVDAHTDDEGLAMITGRLVHAPIVRVLDGSDEDEEDDAGGL